MSFPVGTFWTLFRWNCPLIGWNSKMMMVGDRDCSGFEGWKWLLFRWRFFIEIALHALRNSGWHLHLVLRPIEIVLRINESSINFLCNAKHLLANACTMGFRQWLFDSFTQNDDWRVDAYGISSARFLLACYCSLPDDQCSKLLVLRAGIQILSFSWRFDCLLSSSNPHWHGATKQMFLYGVTTWLLSTFLSLPFRDLLAW